MEPWIIAGLALWLLANLYLDFYLSSFERSRQNLKRGIPDHPLVSKAAKQILVWTLIKDVSLVANFGLWTLWALSLVYR